MKLDRIVVGIDFSEPSCAAARWVARHLAPRAEIILVHVIDIPAAPVFLEGRYPLRTRLIAATREWAERRLRTLQAAISEGREAKVQIQMRVGRSYSELIAAALESGADAVAVGQHGPRPGMGRTLGSTAERLLHASTVPVLVARGPMSAPPTRILVPMDDSGPAVRALACARLLQESLGARTVVFHALHPALFTHVRLVTPAEKARRVEKEVEAAAHDWIEEKLREAGFSKDLPTIEIAFGEPRYEILAAARRLESDIVVMGVRGAGAIRPPLLGCVAVAVLHGMQCPVLAVTDAPNAQEGLTESREKEAKVAMAKIPMLDCGFSRQTAPARCDTLNME